MNFVLIAILFGIVAKPMMSNQVTTGLRMFSSIILLISGMSIFCMLNIPWNVFLRAGIALTIMAVSAGLFSDVPKWRASYLKKKEAIK